MTDTDNENNAHTGSPDGDLGVYLCGGAVPDAELPVEFNITVTESLITSTTQLCIYADNVQDETAEVYLNENYVGDLADMDASGNTTMFGVPADWVTGTNLVEVRIVGAGCLVVDWGQILVDGGGAENADLLDLTIDDYGVTVVDANVQTSAVVSVAVTGTYSIKFSLVDPSQDTKSFEMDQFSVSTSGLVTRIITPTYSLDYPTGVYQVVAILFDDATDKIQATRHATFYHVYRTGPVEFDFGDAPDPTYPTLLENDGARHTVVEGLYLGASIDSKLDAQPNETATGDDVWDGNDDEDGVTFTSVLRQGAMTNLDVLASDDGYLNAWVDLNADGDWADAGEQIFSSTQLMTGANNLSFPVPVSAVTGTTYARFRFNSTGVLTYAGAADDGEVEDYQVNIEEKNLALNKTAEDLNGAPLFVDDLISYTIVITNEGGITKTDVEVTDTLPAGVTFVSATPGDYAGPGPLVWNVGTLGSGDVWTATVLVRVDGTADPIGGNVVAVRSDQQDEQESAPVFPPAGGDVADGLAINKTAQDLNGAPLYVGDLVRYTVNVTNEYGGPMTDIVISDTLPAGVAVVSATPGGYAGPNPLVWNVSALGPGADWTASIDVVVDGTVTPLAGNVAAVSSDQQNEQMSEPVLPAGGGEVELNPNALALTKTAQDLNGAPLHPGDEILYTVYAVNALSFLEQAQVVITDAIPGGVTYIPGSAASSQGNVSGPDPLVADIGALAAGQVSTLTFRARVNAGALGQVIENYAQADSDQQDPPAGIGPITPPGGGTVEPSPHALALSKTAADLNGAPLHPGDEILYSVRVVNSLGGEQTNVVITDAIPAHTTYVPGSASSSRGSIVIPGPLVVDIGTLAAGQEVTFAFRVTVDVDAIGQVIENYAQADSDQQDPHAGTGPITPPAGGVVRALSHILGLAKTVRDVNGTPLYPQDVLLYSMYVTNLLGIEQTGVVITDAIPAHTTYVPGSASSSQGSITGPDPLVAQVGALAAGQTVTFTFHVTVNADAIGQVIKNYAQADSDQQDPPVQIGPILEPWPVEPVDAVADLAITKDLERPDGLGVVTYTIVARNLGPHRAHGAIVLDNIGSQIHDVTWTCVASGGAACSPGGTGNIIGEALPSFPAGGVVTFTAVGHLGIFADDSNLVTIIAPKDITDPNEDNNVAVVGRPYRTLLPLISWSGPPPIYAPARRAR